MSENTQKQQSGIKDLIAKGREQGYLTYAEVNDHLPEDIADPEQVEDINPDDQRYGHHRFRNGPRCGISVDDSWRTIHQMK